MPEKQDPGESREVGVQASSSQPAQTQPIPQRSQFDRPAGGAAGRARLMRTIQRQVGNTRVDRGPLPNPSPAASATGSMQIAGPGGDGGGSGQTVTPSQTPEQGQQPQPAPPPAPPPAELASFARAFNTEFRSVLHAFTEGGPTVLTEGGQIGRPSGPDVPAERLATLFTTSQRTKLMEFMTEPNHPIPERLFNGDEVGHASEQQRILMSSHILAVGTYRPNSIEQRVHANFCWHWVQIVYHYAGVTPASGGIAWGVMGSFDPHGGVVLGTGRARDIVSPTQTGFRHNRVPEASLPETETPGGVGPLPPGSEHARLSARLRERGRASNLIRIPGLLISQFDLIQAGDWLQYYNANPSASGGHSVIFSRWTSGNLHQPLPDGSGESAVYREAICFSQGQQESGGREHTVRLGDRFIWYTNYNQRIFPITQVTHIDPGAHPATSAEEFLPPSEAGLSRVNQLYLRARARDVMRARRSSANLRISEVRLGRWLQDQNQSLMDQIESRLTAGQKNMLEEVNRRDDIEDLVRLNQRLGALVANARILEEHMEETFTEDLAERRAQALADLQVHDERINSIEAQLEQSEARLREAEQRQSGYNLNPEIRRLWREIRDLPRSLDRVTFRARRQQIVEKIQGLERQQRQRDWQAELREIRAEVRSLRAEAATLRRRRAQAVREREQAHRRTVPYGVVQPNVSGERGRVNGRLTDLYSIANWSDFAEPDNRPTSQRR